VYQGTLIELSTSFKLNNGADSVAVVRRRFLKEVDPAEVEKEKQRLKAAEAVTSSANAIAAAASALRIAEEDSRHTAAALVAAASGKASSLKTRKALSASLHGGGSGGADALAASAAVVAMSTSEDEPEFLKGVPAAPEDARLPKVAVYEMPGYCTYVGAKSHLDRIRGLFVNKATCLPGIDVVAFSMEECKYADPDALEAMGDVVNVRFFWPPHASSPTPLSRRPGGWQDNFTPARLSILTHTQRVHTHTDAGNVPRAQDGVPAGPVARDAAPRCKGALVRQRCPL
jgi:hypothetical protein